MTARRAAVATRIEVTPSVAVNAIRHRPPPRPVPGPVEALTFFEGVRNEGLFRPLRISEVAPGEAEAADTELARDADVAPNTAKRWLSILQSSGLVYLLEPWFTKVTKRIIKTIMKIKLTITVK